MVNPSTLRIGNFVYYDEDRLVKLTVHDLLHARQCPELYSGVPVEGTSYQTEGIRFVHELQNAHFKLLGRELDIDLACMSDIE